MLPPCLCASPSLLSARHALLDSTSRSAWLHFALYLVPLLQGQADEANAKAARLAEALAQRDEEVANLRRQVSS